jgi:SAM-dependent methyltransferase
MRGRTKAGLAAAGALAGGVAWERTHPSALPYSQRWMLAFPRPWLGSGSLLAALEPRPGERILEVGPGLGHGAFPVAEQIAPHGTLAAFDLQQEMLDDLIRRAKQRGVGNIEPRQGDARDLPYDDASFDAAYLVTVLGEIPDQAAALRELRRVVGPSGRAVFGETFLDPHFVGIGALKRRAREAGFRHERTLGVPPLGFYARFAAA